MRDIKKVPRGRGYHSFPFLPYLLFRVLTALSVWGDRAEQGFHFQFSIPRRRLSKCFTHLHVVKEANHHQLQATLADSVSQQRSVGSIGVLGNRLDADSSPERMAEAWDS